MQAEPEPNSSDAAQTAEGPSLAESDSGPSATDASAEIREKPRASDSDDDDSDEESEQPRVGLALTPRRSSLLSVAFGFGEKKATPPKIEQPAKPAEEPAPVKATPETSEVESVVAEIVEPPPSVVEATAKPVPDEPTPARSILAAVRGGAEPAVEQRTPAFEVLDEKIETPAPQAAAPADVRIDEDILKPAATESAAQSAMPFVRFNGIKKTYDGVQLVVKDLNLDIAKGEFLTLLGPSGSGKTTTLMMLAGFEQPTAGDIFLNGQSLTTMPPHKRGLGFVFQNYALFPHMTVAENLAFPLEVRKIGRGEIKDRVAKALNMVELQGFDKRKPHQLSGGQQQRVAVARALVFDPQLVLMDEPLGALDKHLREQMQYELKRLHRELGVTVVYVTHDQGEALTLSDRIAVFHDGAIQQLDTPTKIYDAPANAFVAGFIGENNALPGKIVAIGESECTLELIGGAKVRAMNGNCDAVGRSGVVCVRPENLTVSAETTPGGNHVAALIEDFIFHGDHLRVKLSAPGMNEIVVKAPARGAQFPAKGVAVTLSWDPKAARAFVS